MIGRLNSGSGFNDGGNKKRFVNIDETTDLVNNFHSKNSFLSKIKEAVGCFITHLKSG